jgi:hypothetical protein
MIKRSKNVTLSINVKDIDRAAKKVERYAIKLREAIEELNTATGSMTITERL